MKIKGLTTQERKVLTVWLTISAVIFACGFSKELLEAKPWLKNRHLCRSAIQDALVFDSELLLAGDKGAIQKVTDRINRTEPSCQESNVKVAELRLTTEGLRIVLTRGDTNAVAVMRRNWEVGGRGGAAFDSTSGFWRD